MHLRFLGIFGLFGILGFLPVEVATAAYAPITFRYDHHLFTLDPDLFPGWRGESEAWLLNGSEITPPAEFRVDGDNIPPLPEGITRETRVEWLHDAIRATLQQRIAAKFDREAGAVTIGRDEKGAVTFEGVGLPGRKVDIEMATALAMRALEEGVVDVELPITVTPASVTVTDSELQQMGIREVVTVGESNYAGSPVNRRHNIAVGLSKFNGHIIPQGTIFSFGDVLGPVNGATGYRKELVIKGDRTEPDYGGGLCQVSTTAYRGAWEYGFPIEQRKNHSYAVGYYGPQGTDATVYPPNPDMKFTNNGPSALLMQTHSENDNAFFIYYGTKDKRDAEVWGPVVLGSRAAPPDRTIYTTELPPGARRKVGDRHAGVTVLWFRKVFMPNQEEKTERVLSVYEARPLFYEVGVEALPTDINTPEPPSTF